MVGREFPSSSGKVEIAEHLLGHLVVTLGDERCGLVDPSDKVEDKLDTRLATFWNFENPC
jgi:hypothetical protein